MTLSLDRQNAYRERFRQSQTGWRPATEVYQSLIQDTLRPGMRVLDAGCGRGGVLEQLGEAVDHPIGFDPDPQSLVEHRIPNLPRAVALADALPLQDGCLDLIVCSWVLEHVEDAPIVFAEVARCLKPGGKFIFLTPNALALVTLINRILRPIQHVLVPRLYGRAESDTFPVRYRANSKSRIDQLAKESGMETVEFRSIPDPTYLAFHPILYRISVLLSRFTPAVHLVGVYSRISNK